MKVSKKKQEQIKNLFAKRATGRNSSGEASANKTMEQQELLGQDKWMRAALAGGGQVVLSDGQVICFCHCGPNVYYWNEDDPGDL